jgi:SulP family sulfate permease
VWGRFGRWQLQRWARGIGLDWYPGRRLRALATRETLVADARAGVNVGLLAFPQSIAYSLIAGLPPQCGLMSSGVGALVGPLFSGSRFIVFGPTNATAILLFAGLTAAGVPEEKRAVALPLFVLLVGFFQVAGSVFRISTLLNYVSRSVITGYLTAAAVMIMANQVQHALGFRVSGASTFLAVLSGTLHGLPQTRWPELLIAVGTLAAFLGFPRFFPQLPNVACTLVCMALVALGFAWLDWNVAYLSGFSLREVHLLAVPVDFELMGRMAPPALALAFVAILEGSSVGRASASRSGERLDVNQEMYGMGLANVASALCGGMDASGSLTRSALNWSSGARTALSTACSGLVVLVLLFTVGFLIGVIPKAALAVVVMGIAVSLFNPHHLRACLRTTRSDATVFAVTFGAALLLALDIGIYLGAFTSILLFLRKAGTPELVEYEFNREGQLAEMRENGQRRQPGIAILHAEGDLFFGSTELFVQQSREIINDPSLRVIVLRLKNARHLDATSVLAIEELLDFLRAGGRHLLVSGADRDIHRVFRNSGLLARIGPENFFREIPGNRPTVVWCGKACFPRPETGVLG